jgi:hypothetical protein
VPLSRSKPSGEEKNANSAYRLCAEQFHIVEDPTCRFADYKADELAEI